MPDDPNSTIARQAREALSLTQCAVVESVFAQVERYLDLQESSGQRIDNKAAGFLGLLCGTTALSMDLVLKTDRSPLHQVFLIASLFLGSAVFLILAYMVRKHNERRLEVLFDPARVSCTDSLDLPVPWANNMTPAQKVDHEREHLFAYRRFLVEHLAEVASFNKTIVRKKALFLKLGVAIYLLQVCAILAFIVHNKIGS